MTPKNERQTHESSTVSMPTIKLKAHWHYPTDIRVGAGRINELVEGCQALGMSAPLLITDPGLAALPVVKQVIEMCCSAGLKCELFSQVKSNPNGSNISDGIAAFKKNKHDGVIAFGGGSALDAAKTVALMAGQDRPLWDFEDNGNNWRRVNEDGMAPVIAIPTTAGTGSEVGRASVITDEIKKVKKLIFHPKMLPQRVILDPELTIGLPPAITAATGMDALSHNLEAYCAPFFHPMAEGIAIEGMRLVKDFLPEAYADGSNIEARTQMLVASTMGATSFHRGLGAIHAIAHTLGALYDLHHGLLNAVLMPYVLSANREVIEPRIVRLARYLELPDESFDGFIQWVITMRELLNIPHTLHAIGIDRAEVNTEREVLIGKMAVADICAGGNPIRFSADQYSSIFKNALNGQI